MSGHETPCATLIKCQAEVDGRLNLVDRDVENLTNMMRLGARWAFWLTVCHISVLLTLTAIYGPNVLKTMKMAVLS